MDVPACEFSERQYEFCANCQLQAAYGSYLVGGMPSIPSQVDEALGGYDAVYGFQGGRTVFMQYKVAHFSQAHGRGARTFHRWGRPYFRAPLHQDRSGKCTQHNTLIGLTSPSSEAVYVSPCFFTNAELRTRFARGAGVSVLAGSILAPLSGLPTIPGAGHHSITYPKDASAFRIHSEASGPYRALDSIDSVLERLEPEGWNEQHFLGLRNRLVGLLRSHDISPPDPPEGGEFDGPVAEIAAILEQRVGAVMVLVPAKSGDARF